MFSIGVFNMGAYQGLHENI